MSAMIPRRLAAARPLVNVAFRCPAPKAASTLSGITNNMNAPYDGRNLDTSTDPGMVRYSIQLGDSLVPV